MTPNFNEIPRSRMRFKMVEAVSMSSSLPNVRAKSKTRLASKVSFVLGAVAAVAAIALVAILNGKGHGIVAEWATVAVFALVMLVMAVPFAMAHLVELRRLARLKSLLNPQRDLLRRLMFDAPGTYHHSMAVADMAAEAAERIGGDAVLTRVGATYHDIGKLTKPLFFVENQSGQGNPHDDLPPGISRMIIMNHVKNGLVLGEKHGLPQSVLRFMATHHGTSQTGIPLHRQLALCAEKGEPASGMSEFFRYGGPLPQSREEAIVSLADSIEAASRSLEHPNESKIRGLVRKIVKMRFIDGQLARCALTGEDLEVVCESFTATLVHILHGRMVYPGNESRS